MTFRVPRHFGCDMLVPDLCSWLLTRSVPMNRTANTLWAMLAMALAAKAEMTCDMSAYKGQDGLAAQVRAGVLEFSWRGANRDRLRAEFTIRDGTPLVRELAVRKDGGAVWIILGRNLEPEFQVTSGVRRLSQQQVSPLESLGVALTPEVIGREKWNSFWDAPLMVPGRLNTNIDLPRKQEEIRVAWAKYNAGSCQVKTDGARMEVT